MASPTELTPQERLAITRKAIVRHMNRRHSESEAAGDNGIEHSGKARPDAQGKLGIIKHAVRVWWHRNPASTAVELAAPLLDDYARAHPFKLIGVSAIVGAALVVIRPWRMVSMGALVAATVKSSGITSALISMLSSASHYPENTETQQ